VLTPFPCILDDGAPAKVVGLAQGIELAHTVEASRLTKPVEIGGMEAFDILNMLEPVIEQAKVLITHGRLDTPATVMPGNDDVLNSEHINRKLQDGEQVQVGMDDHVGYVAVDKNLPGGKTEDLARGNPAV
jgi:hypothetical protein